MAEEKDFSERINLRKDEVPLCYDALARFGKFVIGSECLIPRLAKFRCSADCGSCVVATVVHVGIDAAEAIADKSGDVIDAAVISIAQPVRIMLSKGRDYIGQPDSEISD